VTEAEGGSAPRDGGSAGAGVDPLAAVWEARARVEALASESGRCAEAARQAGAPWRHGAPRLPYRVEVAGASDRAYIRLLTQGWASVVDGVEVEHLWHDEAMADCLRRWQEVAP
jgi:hypothetical protein